MHSRIRPSPRLTLLQNLLMSAPHALSTASVAPCTRSRRPVCAPPCDSKEAGSTSTVKTPAATDVMRFLIAGLLGQAYHRLMDIDASPRTLGQARGAFNPGKTAASPGKTRKPA